MITVSSVFRKARWASISALALCLAACGSPSEPTVVGRLQERALADDTAWTLLESLTTEVGPRMAGSPGDALAVAWARQRLTDMGFDRVWGEHVEFPRWVRRLERGAMVAPRHQDLALTALGGTGSTNGVLQGEVVHFVDLAALEAADPAQVEGRIAFISKRMERSQSGAGYVAAVAGRSRGPFVAARKGAAALIIRSVGTDSDRLPHTGMISSTEPGKPVPAAAISNPDADVMVALLERGEAVQVTLELDVGWDGMATSQNVVAEFDGSGETDEFVVLGAHLDSWDLGTGAHDDGAGVAIIMAAARLVADESTRPRRGIRVVLFANEEQGIHGGKTYAAVHGDELDTHIIGAESDLGAGAIYQFRARVNPESTEWLAELERLLEPLGIPYNDDRLAYGGADLSPMRRLGMPVIDLNHDATRYFDLHHTANDTLAQVDPADLRHNVAAYVTFLWHAANSDAALGPVEPSK